VLSFPFLQVYRPLEFLFSVAAFTTLAENFLPQLISLPKVRIMHGCSAERDVSCRAFAVLFAECSVEDSCHGASYSLLRVREVFMNVIFTLQAMVQNLVRATLSLTFVIAAARVVFNVKARMTREATWQLELKGDLTKQRRVEAVDKLLSVLTLLVASVFGLQAIGLDGEAQVH